MSSHACVTIRAAIASRMRSILLFVLLLTAMPLPSAAQQAGAAKSMAGLVEVSADLNGDGVKERAVLLYDRESDDVDLAIYSSADGKLQDQPSVYVASLGWTGNTEGSTPEMTVDDAGSLIVVFRNEAAGRYRWRQQFTIAFRAGSYVVVGYSYMNKDTLTPDQGGACSVDFLSGEGTRDGKPVKVPELAPLLSTWSEESIPTVCTFF